MEDIPLLLPNEDKVLVTVGGVLVMLAITAFNPPTESTPAGRTRAVKAIDLVLLYAAEGGFTKGPLLLAELRANQAKRPILNNLINEAVACIDRAKQALIIEKISVVHLS
jgi:hypothetical protein